MSIKRRLRFGFAFALLLVLSVGAISFATFQKQFREAELVKRTYQVINQLQLIQTYLINMETGRRGFRSTNDKKFLQPYYAGLKQINPSLYKLETLIASNSKQTERLQGLRLTVTQLLNFWKAMGDDASKHDNQELLQIISAEKAKMDGIREQIAEMESDENDLLISRQAENDASVKFAEWGLIVGISLILLTVILLIVQILKEFTNRQKAEEELNLNNKKLLHANQESAEKNWLLHGLSEVNDVLQGHSNEASLSQVVLKTVVKYLNLQAGALYIFNIEHQQLQLTSSFALPKTIKTKYALHEGFVGEAAVEGEPVVIPNISAKYATLSSGTISVDTVHALYVPLHHNNEIKGVLELLSIASVQPKIIEFVKFVSGNIAIAIHGVKEREKVQLLLEQVQQQKEELEHQQEELRQTNEELTVQAEVLQASEEELRVQEEELRQINAEMKEKNRIVERARQSLVIKARELERSSEYKSEFLANMSHELRTPLNSVLILARLLSENKEGNLTDKQVTHAKIIHRSGSDLLQLINDILDLSKIEAGKVDLHIENVAVTNIATDVEQLFLSVADEKSIKFSVEIKDDVPKNIKTDKQKVEQVLKNLLSNAFKFTPQHGRITLTFKQVKEDNATYLSASVADTGIGIAEAKQEVIFEAFQQADGSTNRKYGGTGLGLSITKELARLLKGKLKLQSQENKGITFEILIPFDYESIAETGDIKTNKNSKNDSENVVEQTSVADERHSFTKEDKVILVIEDDKDFAIIIREFAKANGYKTIIALSGDEGLYCTKKYLPSAIILDLSLPGINGGTLLKLFKEDQELKHIPVHVISATDDPNTAAQGALAYLKKPVEKHDLNNAFTLISEYLNSTIKRVLIFSDNNLRDEIFKNLHDLKSHDVVCDHASTLQEGIEMLTKAKYDCIIADIGTNIEDGISKLTELNSHIRPAHVPTIIYLDKDITTGDEVEMKRIADVVVRKSSFSNKRLLDELELFLYKVDEKKTYINYNVSKAANLDSTLQNKKVLLVDDDMRNIFALSSALESQQMEVLTANDGKEALQVLKENENINIVLMDVMMPEMDGYEAIHIIRNEMKLSGLPIIALTAKAMTGDREKCLAAGASDYISKPVDVHKLSSLMRVWLS